MKKFFTPLIKLGAYLSAGWLIMLLTYSKLADSIDKKRHKREAIEVEVISEERIR